MEPIVNSDELHNRRKIIHERLQELTGVPNGSSQLIEPTLSKEEKCSWDYVMQEMVRGYLNFK
jgi:hypothetical protein